MWSLYTSIPHADGLKALAFFLDRRPTHSAYPPTTTLVRLAELVLTLNIEFDSQVFAQISGVAMDLHPHPAWQLHNLSLLQQKLTPIATLTSTLLIILPQKKTAFLFLSFFVFTGSVLKMKTFTDSLP